jgi:uncharacterized repeat protein (TIGR03803 family)
MTRKSHRRCPTRRAMLCIIVLALVSFASAEWKEKVLYSFQGLPDGSLPAGGVVFDKMGNLYGATTEGGSNSCLGIGQCGTVYQLAPPAKKGDPWTETVLYIFRGKNHNDGSLPAGGVIIDEAGNLYGTTAYGGAGTCILLGGNVGCGTVYELSPPAQKGGPWTEIVLYSFPTAKQGYLPNGDLVFDSAGNLYGATQFGGGHGTTCNSLYQYCGAVFELSPPKTKGGKWTEKVLYSFKGGKDGANPNGGLVFDSKGALFGTTPYGGGSTNCKTIYFVGCGTVFRLNPPTTKSGAWTETMLRRFNNGADGAGPNGGLIFDAKGRLYGTAAAGAIGHGMVFRLKPPLKRGDPWQETLLHSFTGADGADPMAGLTFDPTGNLYGTTCCDGKPGGGTIFRLTPLARGGWTLKVLHSFTGTPDGSYPAAKIVFDKSGNLYSTTQQSGYTGQPCGQNGCGTVFMVMP